MTSLATTVGAVSLRSAVMTASGTAGHGDELAGYGEQCLVAQSIGVEYDGCRIAGEASGGERVYLKNAQGCLRRPWGEFCTHPRVRLHLYEPWGGL